MLELFLSGDYGSLKVRLIVWSVVILIAWVGMAVACFADMWSGVSTAKALGEKIHSHRLRETLNKIKDYAGVMLPFLFVDIIGSMFSWYDMPFAQILLGLGAIFIEGWSIFENKKRKKSHAALLPDLIKQIIECGREKDAEAIIEAVEKAKELRERQKESA